MHPAIVQFMLTCVLLVTCGSQSFGAVPAREVLELERQRVEVMRRASEAAVAIFDASGQGGGSGVVITPDGLALTNFHVVAPCGTAMKCGMNNGEIYDAVVVGIDPVGDVALIQLLGRDDFPTADIGDSDTVQVGDWVFAVGNPFLLADDFHPSVSYGMVSGVRRYQYPAGTLLEYADCIQTDAAINPGNSGGPLFAADGKLIGVNGRGSFEKRGRVNVGVGYAISINQIKRFISHLESGRIVDHASLGATVSTVDIGNVVVDDILETSDAFRRGLRYGDQILRVAGRDITTANSLQNVIATFPRDWTVPVRYRRQGQVFNTNIRLMGAHDPSQLIDMVQKEAQRPMDPPDGRDPKGDSEEDGPEIPGLGKRKPSLPEAVAERYEARRGYSNYWYNLKHQRRLWEEYRGGNALEGVGYDWKIAGTVVGGSPFEIEMSHSEGAVRLPTGRSGAIFTDDLDRQLSPPGSGGLLVALHLWQRMLDRGLQQFGEVYYLGQLPLVSDGTMADCLVGYYGGLEIRFLFSLEVGDLVGIDLFTSDYTDPCEIRFSDFTDFEGRRLPSRWKVVHGDNEFADIEITQWQMVTAAEESAEVTN